jgi:1-acyl-sn-glycerol-3-phosphate acyltransferase
MTLYPSIFGYILKFFLKAFLRFFLKIRHRIEAELPPGPKVFAVNHPTVWDAFPILSFVKGTYIHTLVEEQVWSFLVPRMIFRLSNQIVLYRSEKSKQTISDSIFVLAKNHSVLIAPQGERTDPKIKVRARKGVVRLALAAEATVIPVGAWIDERNIVMKNVRYKYQNKRYTVPSYFPRFRSRYGFIVGKPMFLDDYFGRDLSRNEYQRIATEILERIYELSAKAAGLFPASA